MVKKRILIVDDETQFTRMVKLNLERTGKYEVREENHGAKAVEAAREFRPDLTLLDIMMPDMEGSDVAAVFRDDPMLSQIKIVFLTAIVTKEETQPTGSTIAGNVFLAKPVKTEDLVTCIENALKG